MIGVARAAPSTPRTTPQAREQLKSSQRFGSHRKLLALVGSYCKINIAGIYERLANFTTTKPFQDAVVVVALAKI